MVDNEHGHPAAGLCKKCWRSFTDREAFDAHFRGVKCETASRSKREKFQALIDTFCVTSQSRQRSVAGSHDSADEGSDDAEGDNDVPMVSAVPGSHARSEEFVSRREYQTLVDRVTTLEHMLTGRLPSSTPRTMPSQQSTVTRAFTTSPAIPSQEFGYYSFGSGQTSSAAVGRDPRTSIVTGMGTRSAEDSDHNLTDFYSGTDRIVPTYRPNINRRTDSMSTVVRRASPRTAGAAGPASQQAGGNPTGRSVSDSAYETSSGGNPGSLVGGHHLPTSQGRTVAFESAAAAAASTVAVAEDTDASQQSTNTMMRNRWEHAVQVGEEMMRGMDFFNTQGSSSDDLSKFLNMDSQ